MRRYLVALASCLALPALALEPIRVANNVYSVRGATEIPSAAELEDFDVAYQRTDWSRFAHLPAFEAANRRNAYNTYIRMQGGEK